MYGYTIEIYIPGCVIIFLNCYKYHSCECEVKLAGYFQVLLHLSPFNGKKKTSTYPNIITNNKHDQYYYLDFITM